MWRKSIRYRHTVDPVTRSLSYLPLQYQTARKMHVHPSQLMTLLIYQSSQMCERDGSGAEMWGDSQYRIISFMLYSVLFAVQSPSSSTSTYFMYEDQDFLYGSHV